MAKTLEFFFDYGSPYSWLACTQIDAIAQRTSAEVRWRPFLLGAVFKATGNHAPAQNMYKARYLLKDLGDWTRAYGLPAFVLPPDFPSDSIKANRLGLVAEELGKLPAYSHAVYRAGFTEGRDISQPQVLADLLRGAGMDPQAAFARMLSQEIKDRLRKNTDEAVERGAFGAPTFFIGDDMYFGNDRLPFVEAALRR
ncbi:MAG: 2-hydroxychromene-2-carboxylate isomerase [Myxococcaceae bacterium]